MGTLHDLQHAVGGQLKASAELAGKAGLRPLGRTVADSREVEPGDVFWALPGEHHDGAEFADEAFARGAAGAVVAREVSVPDGRWAVQVEDSLQALWQWAAWKRHRFAGSVIAVTGSVGKTTTRQMIHTVLRSRLRGTASPRNWNHRVGLALSMLAIEPGHDYAVLEMASSGPDEIAAMVALSRPTLGVVTHVSDAQPGGFRGRRKVAEALGEFLAGLPLDGYAVLGEDAWLRRVASRCKAPITWVGRGVTCDLVAADVEWTGGRLSFRIAGREFSVPVWGRHHLISALIAVAVGRLLGSALEETAQALAQLDSLPARCAVSEVRGATIIDDAHNADPAAMRAALELLRDFDAPGRRILLLGDMPDLGDEAPHLHRQLGNQVVTLCGADLLIACGQHAGDVVAAARAAGMPQHHAIACATPDETLPYLGQTILPGDVALVKGARALAMDRVVDALQHYPRRRTA